MNQSEAEMIFEGNGILLRYAKDSDLDAFFELMQDAEMAKLTGSQHAFTYEEIAGWINKISIPSLDRVDLMIISKETKELVGEIVLNELDSINRSANIRIAIGATHTGKGYGSEAMNLMLKHGFETLKLHRIHLGVFAFNPRAIHVYEKVGFRQEGIQRDALYAAGQYHDMIMMAMLEDEYASITKL